MSLLRKFGGPEAPQSNLSLLDPNSLYVRDTQAMKYAKFEDRASFDMSAEEFEMGHSKAPSHDSNA